MQIGITELTVLFIIIGIFAGGLILPLVLRDRYPERLWMGMLLCLLSPFGHLYLKGGALYIIGLLLFGGVAQTSPVAAVFMFLLSPLLFWHRLSKVRANATA